jgi:hypothetical protein
MKGARIGMESSFAAILLLLSLVIGCSVQVDNEGSLVDVVLAWDPPANNSDGTPLTDLVGYRVYYGDTSGVYSNSYNAGGSTSCSITVRTSPEGHFVVVAYDESGCESIFSDPVDYPP